jgi:hypothetical protein
MHILLRTGLTPLVLIALALGLPQAREERLSAPNVPAGERIVAISQVAHLSSPELALLDRARKASDLAMHTEFDQIEAQASRWLRACVGALADLPRAAEFPWLEWQKEALGDREDLSLALFQAYDRVDPKGSYALARELDLRSTPISLRLAAHRVLWRVDPLLAVQRGHRLATEAPRGTKAMHARYVATVLAHAPRSESIEVLLTFAHREGLESQARCLAIDLLAERGGAYLAADLATLFRASTGDLTVRKKGLLATLELDPYLGKEMLMNDVPNEAAVPGLYQLVRELREQYGLPALP